MQIPSFLKSGDQIRIVSPSGNIDASYIDGAAECLGRWGFTPEIGRYAKSCYGRYGGTIEERLSDLLDAFRDKAVKAILCSRGGYGIMQLLELIPPEIVQNNPKWVIGYSDITALHAFMQNCGVASIHAPMAKHLSEADDLSTSALRGILLGEFPQYQFESHSLNRDGECQGELIGGNLSVLMGLRGTKFDMQPEGKILFLEDIGERPYHVERMMLNLKMSGVLAKLSGLIVGQFTDYEEDPLMMKPLMEIIADTVAEYSYPVAFNFPVGHVSANYPLIGGAQVELKMNKNPSLSFRLSE